MLCVCWCCKTQWVVLNSCQFMALAEDCSVCAGVQWGGGGACSGVSGVGGWLFSEEWVFAFFSPINFCFDKCSVMWAVVSFQALDFLIQFLCAELQAMIEYFREQGFSFSVNCVGYVFIKVIEVCESFKRCLHFTRKNSWVLFKWFTERDKFHLNVNCNFVVCILPH